MLAIDDGCIANAGLPDPLFIVTICQWNLVW